jgi:hypothetical protein
LRFFETGETLKKIWVFRIWFERGLNDDVWTPGIEALASLCNGPYWNRVWIVQELFLARRLTLQCGDDGVDYEKLLEMAWPWFVPSWPKSIDGTSSYPAITVLWTSAGICLLDKKVNKLIGLSQLIDEFQDSQCALAHDRVYGYLSIASDYNDDFSIDYGKSLDELYHDLISFHCRHLEHHL